MRLFFLTSNLQRTNIVSRRKSLSMDGTLTIRVDNLTKRKAKIILDELGLDLSTAINLYLKQIIKKGGIPFMINEPNEEFIKAIQSVEKGDQLIGPFDSVDELMKYLESPDDEKDNT